MHFAASNGHAQVVDYLLERGADPDIEDQYGCTPIDIALAQGYTDIYKSLMEYSTLQNDTISVPQMPYSMVYFYFIFTFIFILLILYIYLFTLLS